MTAGITGVLWLPRMAEANSIALNTGAHAIPISAAATAWGTLTAAWVDATTTVARVIAELGVGMQGVQSIAALAKIGGFTAWAEQTGALAAAMGSKAGSNATAYTVATIAMPSLPEIIALETARAASHASGGALRGDAEILEAMKVAMDVRAALTMNTYEAATTAMVLTPGEFAPPPSIATGAGQANMPDFVASTMQSVTSAAAGVVNNPAVAAAGTHITSFAGTVASGGVGTIGNLGASTIPAAAAPAAPVAAVAAPMAPTTRVAGFAPGPSVSNGTVKLPEGWAAPASETSASRVEATRTGGTGSPLMGRSNNNNDDEAEHESIEYAKDNEAFTDGRYVADGVIGANPVGAGK